DSNGAMIEKEGWICFKYEEYDGTYYSIWYYGNGDGTVKTNQWIQSGKDWYYVVGDGVMITDQSLDIDGKEYIFDSNGVCINPY
ncbi:MAG: hypothetical protein IJ094_11920, partial [Bacilli bacterium]|nr:hypothetical protein [Bacilli bacterium]